ncbi:MAG: 2-amino-4-hydroxy-6-hydroxymethyldihydropteridine diphosphokinase [Lautropia sp.]|nr:2-amino-4-hydroxy-6-hydroxymethyldihydropteridine diphosphokinase [Lautropia sp.]
MSTHTSAWIGLGANLPSHVGSPADTLASALAHVARLPETRLDAVSGFYQSSPVDSDGPVYGNRVARISTALGAQALLDGLRLIERAFGRERPYRNAPRTLDLDVLLYGELGTERCDSAELTLPHPRMHQRLFVLMPLAEIDPLLEIPGHGRVDGLLAALLASGTDQICEKHPTG